MGPSWHQRRSLLWKQSKHMVRSFNYIKIYIVSTSPLLTISSFPRGNRDSFQGYKKDVIIKSWSCFCAFEVLASRKSILIQQKQLRRCFQCHKAAMFLMLLKTNLTKTWLLVWVKAETLSRVSLCFGTITHTFWRAEHKARCGMLFNMLWCQITKDEP